MKRKKTYRDLTATVAVLGLLALSLFVPCPASAAAEKLTVLEGDDWPRRFFADKVEITVFQPEIERFKGDRIEARSAVSLNSAGDEPIFGAMRYAARALTDTEKRLVYFSELVMESVKFPDKDKERLKALEVDIEKNLSSVRFSVSLDRFVADLDATELGVAKSSKLDNAPPRIFYKDSPAVLVLIDGEPILKEIEGTEYRYVVNTPFFIVREKGNGPFYLKGGKWWYSSDGILEGWRPVEGPPKKIEALAAKAFTGDAADEDVNTSGLDKAPEVLVSTEPAELIQTRGSLQFLPISGTSLLYVENTENDIVLDIDTQKYYVLISGRWYTSKSLYQGEWSFIRGDRLPGDFSKIPKDSGIANVRSSVAGTEEADAAVLENAIPQTAQIYRDSTTTSVSYDGDATFRRIAGTQVYYAVNADKVVLKIRGRFYAVDNGVWFESNAAHGPWEVAIAVPREVQDIPPSEPVYHVRYVYIYDYTPDVVYVGYTPGYYCSYVYYGTVVYGTGYYYRSWYGHYYYPWPATFGFAVHYNPFTGWWGFPVGISYGWLAFGWFPFPYAYWGPAGYFYGYRHGYYHSYPHGYYDGYRNGYMDGYSAGRVTGYRAVGRESDRRIASSRNIYKTLPSGVRQTGVKATTAGRPPRGIHPSFVGRNEAGVRSGKSIGLSRPGIGDARSMNPGSKTPLGPSQKAIRAPRSDGAASNNRDRDIIYRRRDDPSDRAPSVNPTFRRSESTDRDEKAPFRIGSGRDTPPKVESPRRKDPPRTYTPQPGAPKRETIRKSEPKPSFRESPRQGKDGRSNTAPGRTMGRSRPAPDPKPAPSPNRRGGVRRR